MKQHFLQINKCSCLRQNLRITIYQLTTTTLEMNLYSILFVIDKKLSCIEALLEEIIFILKRFSQILLVFHGKILHIYVDRNININDETFMIELLYQNQIQEVCRLFIYVYVFMYLCICLQGHHTHLTNLTNPIQYHEQQKENLFFLFIFWLKKLLLIFHLSKKCEVHTHTHSHMTLYKFCFL